MCMVIYYLKSIWVCLCCLSLLFQTQIALFPYVPDYFSLFSGHCSWKFICGSFLRSTMDRVSYRGFVFVFTEPHGVVPVWEPYKTKFITWSWFRPWMIKVLELEWSLICSGMDFLPSLPFFLHFLLSKQALFGARAAFCTVLWDCWEQGQALFWLALMQLM